MTTTSASSGRRLEPLAGALADIVCWLLFYLDNADEEEITPEAADGLFALIAERLERLPVGDRLLFLEHASFRAQVSTVEGYQAFLLDMAETLGLE